jgi:hypothetical protein
MSEQILELALSMRLVCCQATLKSSIALVSLRLDRS